MPLSIKTISIWSVIMRSVAFNFIFAHESGLKRGSFRWLPLQNRSMKLYIRLRN